MPCTRKLFSTQITVDYSVEVSLDQRHAIVELAARLAPSLGVKSLEDFLQKCSRASAQDIEITGASRQLIQRLIKTTEGYVPRSRWKKVIGGTPGIAALASMCLRPATLDDVADSYFVGNIGNTVLETLSEQYPQNIRERFIRGNPTPDFSPVSLALETLGFGRVIFPFSEGRNLADFPEEVFFARLSSFGKENLVLIVEGLNKGSPEAYSELILRAKKVQPIKVMVGTNSFNNPKTAREIYELIFPHSDLISFNEVEIMEMYAAIGGAASDTPLQALQAMHVPGRTLVVHSAAGAVLKHDCNYSVTQALDLACSGASFRVKHARYGSEPEILKFFEQKTPAIEDFEGTLGQAQKGMDACYAHKLEKPSLLVGSGGTFNGILISYLAPSLFREQ
jgi:sugar/nucleoside kinase (ribokinase family)